MSARGSQHNNNLVCNNWWEDHGEMRGDNINQQNISTGNIAFIAAAVKTCLFLWCWLHEWDDYSIALLLFFHVATADACKLSTFKKKSLLYRPKNIVHRIVCGFQMKYQPEMKNVPLDCINIQPIIIHPWPCSHTPHHSWSVAITECLYLIQWSYYRIQQFATESP